MSSYKDAEVGRLVRLSRDRDDGAFVELVERYTPLIKKLISSVDDPSLTYDELFSESCIALHRAASSFDLDQDDVSFGLYAQICVSHRLSDLVKSHIAKVAPISDVDVSALAVSSGIDSRLEREERMHNIMKVARDLLSDYEYRVMMLHIQGYKTGDIARMLSKDAKSVDNAKNRLFRRLRAVLSDGGEL